MASSRGNCIAKPGVFTLESDFFSVCVCVYIYISTQHDVTVSRFLFWKLYMFQAFLAYHQESLNCIGSRWHNKLQYNVYT
jgi:hypothetical protein